MKFVICLQDQRYAPSFKSIDHPDLTTINMTREASDALRYHKFCADDIMERHFYDSEPGRQRLCVEVDLPVVPVVKTNYNGYTIVWSTEDQARENPGVIDLKSYREWNNTHECHWENNNREPGGGKWVYRPKNQNKEA